MPNSKKDFTSAFAADMVVRGFISIPDILLRFYKELGLSELEIMVLIHLLRYAQVENNHFPSPEHIQRGMTIDAEQVKVTLAELMEKEFLSVAPRFNEKRGCWESAFCLDGLFEKLSELWACEKARHYNAQQMAPGAQWNAPSDPESGVILSNLYKMFEKEFGRLLSPIEAAKIDEWNRAEGISEEIICEALKRSVLRGVLNFKYIDSILRDWNKNGIKTVKEAVIYEEQFLQRKEQMRIMKNSKRNVVSKKDAMVIIQKQEVSELCSICGGRGLLIHNEEARPCTCIKQQNLKLS
ncbi:MAG: DnaD domain protein [Syntrophomonadaceae bacterium]|nr:DnaD domain protein [Syntrophomonadaceae bacterium]